MITYVFLGITGVWFVVSAIVGAFQTLIGDTVTTSMPSTVNMGSPGTNIISIVQWVGNSVSFFFSMFTFSVPGAEAFSLVWIFMGFAWAYCLFRMIHTGGT